MQGIPNIDSFVNRLEELDNLMQAPDFYGDRRRAASVSKEHQKLSELIGTYRQLEKTEQDIMDNQSLIDDVETDSEMRELAQMDMDELKESLEALREQVLKGMIPPDPAESRNTIIEIRAGAGGDEASIFAGDLYRMYTRFAETKGWKIEPMSSSLSDHGYKEISFLVTGEDVYKTLKFESGVHRVQRVPDTEASGRIHTSTATVAVLPEAEEVDVQIDPNEIEIKVCRASGPGGQGVNTTDSAVQIFHKPTDMIVVCSDERSQLKNKAKALAVLRSRLLQKKQDEEEAKYASHRKDQIGSGDRSERIRTYNFSQGRISDHRINLTLYNLPQFMEGDIEEVTRALEDEDYRLKIEALLGGSTQPA